MIERNTDDQESKEFWDFVDKRFEATEKWPEWKKQEVLYSESHGEKPMNFDTDTIQCGMSRSRKGEQITVSIRPDDLAVIDRLRGSTSRSEYMREASKGPVLRVSMELLETISKLAKTRGMSPEGLLAVWADKDKNGSK